MDAIFGVVLEFLGWIKLAIKGEEHNGQNITAKKLILSTLFVVVVFAAFIAIFMCLGSVLND